MRRTRVMLVNLTIPLPVEVVLKLDELAAEKGCSRSAMAREMLLAGLERWTDSEALVAAAEGEASA